MNNEYMSIGEVSKKMKVSVRTLQYYDKEGLLKPSYITETRRRKYSAKDIVKLHQILSFKYLGFSLEEIKNHLFTMDTPQEVETLLSQQKDAIDKQIKDLLEAKNALIRFQKEVHEMEEVDFKKYAEIIEMLRQNNSEYWVWKHMDETLTSHIESRFSKDPQKGLEIFETYKAILFEAQNLHQQKEPANSELSLLLAEKWWNMILEFTGGDLSLVSELEKFNDNKDAWNNDLAKIQKEVDLYLEEALQNYFIKLNTGGKSHE